MILNNLSSKNQRRWVSVTLPADAVAPLGGRGTVAPYGWPWLKGERRGDLHRIWIRADLEGQQMVHLVVGQLADADPGYLGEVLHPGLLDNKDQVIRVRGNVDGAAFDLPLEYERIETMAGNNELMVVQLGARVGGLHVRMYATLGAGCPAVELQGWVVWSDRQKPTYFGSVNVQLMTGDPSVAELSVVMGLGPRSGVRQQEITSHRIVDQALFPDAMGVPWYGALFPIVGNLQTADLDMGAYEAALEGGVTAAATESDFEEGFGPQPPGDRALTSLLRNSWDPRADINAHRDFWARRPWANEVMSGSAGDQGCFGRIKATNVLSSLERGGKPTLVQELRYSSTDYWLRSHHHMGTDGRPLVPRPEAGQRTYNGYLARGYEPSWGKTAGGPPYSGFTRAYMSRQHRGNLYAPIAYGLLADPIMDDELSFLLLSDQADRRQVERTWEASRSSGRLLQEWAWWWCFAGTDHRMMLEELALTEIDIVMSRRCGREGAGPVAPAGEEPIGDKNPLRTVPAWAPWQESILCDGLLAWLNIWSRTEEQTPQKMRVEGLLRVLGSTIVNKGVILSATGPLFIGWAMLPEFGQDYPDGYMNYPRAGAGTAIPPLTSPPINLLVGGISPFWFVGGLEAGLRFGDEPTKERARQILRNMRLSDRQQWEWSCGADAAMTLLYPQ